MTASEKSFLGLGKQAEKGTEAAAYEYLLFSEGGVGPNSIVLPLDQEVGGGALLRSMEKMGVTSAGAINFIPRPDTLGHFLMAALGQSAAPAAVGTAVTAKSHVFTLPDDQFAAPYYSLKSAPGNMFTETFLNCRIANLALSWRALDYVRAAASFMGGMPQPVGEPLDPGATLALVDGGPQFTAPLVTVSSAGGSFDGLKVLSGSITAGMVIPMEDQWISGSYEPDDFDINSRAFAIQLGVKITDDVLYKKMQYDPAGGSEWVAQVFKNADIAIELKSPTIIEQDGGTDIPYSLKIEANGESTQADSNVVWSAQPIGMRAGRQIVMGITGVFLASPTATAPITATLVNDRTTQY